MAREKYRESDEKVDPREPAVRIAGTGPGSTRWFMRGDDYMMMVSASGVADRVTLTDVPRFKDDNGTPVLTLTRGEAGALARAIGNALDRTEPLGTEGRRPRSTSG